MTRPPAFKLPAVNPPPLFLFFGHGDYVIARDAAEASVFWMDHFGEISYAKEFEQLPSEEEIELYVESDDSNCQLWVMTREELDQEEKLLHRPARPDQWLARELIERFGPGYLASTTED